MTDKISSSNSSAAPLGASGSFVGAGEPVSAYSSVTVTVRGNVVGSGTLYIGFSPDNSTWSEVAVVIPNIAAQSRMTFKISDYWYRMRFVNSATGQSAFRIQSSFLINPTAGSQGSVGPAGPTGPPGPGSVNEAVQRLLLSSLNISTKSFPLSYTPLAPAAVKLFPEGGLLQRYGVDFTVTGSTVSWNGLGLDGFLAQGDEVAVYYLY